MHELGIVFTIAKSVEEVAAENHVSKVCSVTLEIGQVSGIIGSYLTDCWDWNAKKSAVLSGSKLLIEEIKAMTYCEDCGGKYETVPQGKTCPYCGSGNTYLLTGNEVNIKEIAVADEESETEVNRTQDVEASQQV